MEDSLAVCDTADFPARAAALLVAELGMEGAQHRRHWDATEKHSCEETACAVNTPKVARAGSPPISRKSAAHEG
eukprot:scaffold4298_cov99-Isochrysis_galbana.AAC.7